MACYGNSPGATLVQVDSAEGVPVRYRRERLTVHRRHSVAVQVIDHQVMPDGRGRKHLPARHRGRSTPQAAATLDRLSTLGPRAVFAVLPSSRSGPAITFRLLSQPGVIERASSVPRHPRGGLEQVTGLIAERSAGLQALGVPAVIGQPATVGRFDPAESARLAGILDPR